MLVMNINAFSSGVRQACGVICESHRMIIYHTSVFFFVSVFIFLCKMSLFRLVERKHPKYTFKCLFYCTLFASVYFSYNAYLYTNTDCFLEFVSPLKQHLHRPKLRVLLISIFWRYLLKGLVIYYSHKFIQFFFSKKYGKNTSLLMLF